MKTPNILFVSSIIACFPETMNSAKPKIVDGKKITNKKTRSKKHPQTR